LQAFAQTVCGVQRGGPKPNVLFGHDEYDHVRVSQRVPTESGRESTLRSQDGLAATHPDKAKTHFEASPVENYF